MTWGVGARKQRAKDLKTYRVLASFHYEGGWHISFYDNDRGRSQLPRRAFCHDDEALLAFIQRAGGAKDSDIRFYLGEAIKRQHGDVTLYLNAEQYDKLRMIRQ